MEQTAAPVTVSLLLPPCVSFRLVIGRRLGGGENERLRPIDARNSAPVISLRMASFLAAAAAAAATSALLVVLLLLLLSPRGTALDEAAARGAAAAAAMRSYPLPTLTVVHAGSQLPVAGGSEGGDGGGLGVATVIVGRPERVRRAFGACAERGWSCFFFFLTERELSEKKEEEKSPTTILARTVIGGQLQ